MRINAQKELDWYYNNAHADCGISSSFGVIIAASFGFSPSNSENYTEDKMVALISNTKSPVKKLRDIERALNKLSKQDRRILDALYNNYNFPPQLVSVFGIRTGSAIFNNKITTINQLVKLCAKKLSKQILNEEELSNLNIIHEQKDNIFFKAHQSYIKSRYDKYC